jgi:hypothetical protein
MITMKRLTKKLLKEIETEAIYGKVDNDGNKQYKSIKKLAESYNVSYDALRKHAGTGQWLQKRKEFRTKVGQKVTEKKAEIEAEMIVQSDAKFMDTGEKLRQAVDIKIDKVLNDAKAGVYPSGYELKMIGDGLKAAQDVVKTAQGEALPSVAIDQRSITMNILDPKFCECELDFMRKLINK